MSNFRPNNDTNRNTTTSQKWTRTSFILEDDETDDSYNFPKNRNEQEKSEDLEIMTLKHEYQLKKHESDDLLNHINNFERLIVEKRLIIEQVMGKTKFEMFYPDINTKPEKYLNTDGELGKLITNKINLQQTLNIIEKELENIVKRIVELNPSSWQLFKEIKVLRHTNNQLIIEKRKLNKQIDELKNEVLILKNELSVKQILIDEQEQTMQEWKIQHDKIIEDMRKTIESYERGNIWWMR